MDEPLTHPADRAAAQRHFRMIGRPDVTPHVAPEEPQAAIVPPRPVADPMAHEVIQAIDPVPVVLGLADCVANFLRQFQRDPLIRIEYENPLMRRLRDRPILEVATRAILTLDDPAPELTRDLERPVGRPRIGHEHFIRNLPRTGDTCADVIALVLARNDDRKLAGHSGAKFRFAGAIRSRSIPRHHVAVAAEFR